MCQEYRDNFMSEIEYLHFKHEKAKEITDDYFEPGMMEYLEQWDGIFNEMSSEITLRFEVKGTRYEGRTERIERVHLGDIVQIMRDKENPYNANNFKILRKNGQDIGNMPAELCNVIAPLFDKGYFKILESSVSYVEPISKRSRHAKQAILFVEIKAVIEMEN